LSSATAAHSTRKKPLRTCAAGFAVETLLIGPSERVDKSYITNLTFN